MKNYTKRSEAIDKIMKILEVKPFSYLLAKEDILFNYNKIFDIIIEVIDIETNDTKSLNFKKGKTK